MPTIVGISTFMSRKNSIQGVYVLKNADFFIFTYEHLKFHVQLSLAWKKFYNLGTRLQPWTLDSNCRLHSESTKSIKKRVIFMSIFDLHS